MPDHGHLPPPIPEKCAPPGSGSAPNFGTGIPLSTSPRFWQSAQRLRLSLVIRSAVVRSLNALIGRGYRGLVLTVGWSYRVVVGRNWPVYWPWGFPGWRGRVVDLPRSSDLSRGWPVQPVVVLVKWLLVPVIGPQQEFPPQCPFHPFIGY